MLNWKTKNLAYNVGKRDVDKQRAKYEKNDYD